MDRRTFLRTLPAIGVGLAGCTGGDGGDGGATPADTPTPTATDTPAPTPTATPEPTPTPSPAPGTPTPESRATPTAEATNTPAPTPTETAEPTPTASPTPRSSVTQTVAVGPGGRLRFEPQSFSISAGDTVRWVWESGGHNIRPESQPSRANWPGDDEQLYGEGHTHTYTFESRGEYEYFCVPHRSVGMVGSFLVE